MSKPLPRVELLRLSKAFQEARSAKRQRLVAHLHAAGIRPTLEALIAVSQGQDLDLVLADFNRLSVETYHAMGANVLPVDQPLTVFEGGGDE